MCKAKQDQIENRGYLGNNENTFDASRRYYNLKNIETRACYRYDKTKRKYLRDTEKEALFSDYETKIISLKKRLEENQEFKKLAESVLLFQDLTDLELVFNRDEPRFQKMITLAKGERWDSHEPDNEFDARRDNTDNGEKPY